MEGRARQRLVPCRSTGTDADMDAMLQQVQHVIMHHVLGQPQRQATAASTIEALPRLKVQAAKPEPAAIEAAAQAPAGTLAAVSAGQQCAVCHDDFVADAEVVQLPCRHCFHEHCILPWLEGHSTCPVCRKQLQQGSPGSARPERGSNVVLQDLSAIMNGFANGWADFGDAGAFQEPRGPDYVGPEYLDPQVLPAATLLSVQLNFFRRHLRCMTCLHLRCPAPRLPSAAPGCCTQHSQLHGLSCRTTSSAASPLYPLSTRTLPTACPGRTSGPSADARSFRHWGSAAGVQVTPGTPFTGADLQMPQPQPQLSQQGPRLHSQEPHHQSRQHRASDSAERGQQVGPQGPRQEDEARLSPLQRQILEATAERLSEELRRSVEQDTSSLGVPRLLEIFHVRPALVSQRALVCGFPVLEHVPAEPGSKDKLWSPYQLQFSCSTCAGP